MPNNNNLPNAEPKKEQEALEKLIEALKTYGELRLQQFTISASEKTAKAASTAIVLLLVLVILLFSFIFVNISIAVVLSNYMGSWAIGFGIFGIFYLLLTVFSLLFAPKFIRLLFNIFINIIVTKTQNYHENENE